MAMVILSALVERFSVSRTCKILLLWLIKGLIVKSKNFFLLFSSS